MSDIHETESNEIQKLDDQQLKVAGGADVFPAKCTCFSCGTSWNGYISKAWYKAAVCPYCGARNWPWWHNVDYTKYEGDPDKFVPTIMLR